MRYLLVIAADSNDDDMVLTMTELDEAKEEDARYLALVLKVARVLDTTYSEADRYKHNWEYGEHSGAWSMDRLKTMYEGFLTEVEIEEFTEHLNVGEYGYGIHSIYTIKLYPIQEPEYLFDLRLKWRTHGV